MRIITLIIWATVLFVFTCVANSGFWLTDETPYFHWSASDVVYQDVFKVKLELSARFITQKIGHFIGFAIFVVLLFRFTRNAKRSIIISILYAVFTEILQLYFGRDGRIMDVVIDSAGILLGIYLVRIKIRLNQLDLSKSKG